MDILRKLATSKTSFQEDIVTIEAILSPPVNEVILPLELEESLDQFKNWFIELIVHEPPPQTIKGLNFGLFESSTEGFTLYVTGANRYDSTDPDWACTNDWWPKGRYAKISLFDHIKQRLRNTETKPWIVVQAIAIVLIKAIFVSNFTEFQSLSQLSGVHITTGFDEGDLYYVTLIQNVSVA